MLTDTLVSWQGADLGQLILPGTLANAQLPVNFSADVIARKLYFLNDRIAAVCAGNVEDIKRFLIDAISQIEVINKFDNPLVPLQNMGNDYTGRVEAIVSWKDIEAGKSFFISHGNSPTINKLGKCSFIGSGANEIEHDLRQHAAYLPNDRWQLSGYDIAADLAGCVASGMIGNDLLFGWPRDWGGFAEWGFFSSYLGKWSYSNPALYGFVLGVPLNDNKFTLEQSSYWYCYYADQVRNTGTVLAVKITDKAILHQWTLDNILVDHPAPERTYSDWIGWKPQDVNIQIFPYGRVELGRNFVNGGNFEGLTFELNNNYVQIGIDQGLMDQWGSVMAEAWGREYVPLPNIADDLMVEAFRSATRGGWGT